MFWSNRRVWHSHKLSKHWTVCCFSIQINHPQRPAMAIDRLIPPNDASLWRNKNNLNSDAECCFATGQLGLIIQNCNRIKFRLIAPARRQQVVTELKMAQFIRFLRRNKRCSYCSSCSKWSLILILNPQVVKEIVTDIMIIISPYFLLDNILRNILVSWKVSLEEEPAHATSACLPPVSEQSKPSFHQWL